MDEIRCFKCKEKIYFSDIRLDYYGTWRFQVECPVCNEPYDLIADIKRLEVSFQ